MLRLGAHSYGISIVLLALATLLWGGGHLGQESGEA